MYKHYVTLINTYTSYTEETFVVLNEVDETLAEIVCEEKILLLLSRRVHQSRRTEKKIKGR